MNDWITEQLALCEECDELWRITEQDGPTLIHPHAVETDERFLLFATDGYPAALRMLRVAVGALEFYAATERHFSGCSFERNLFADEPEPERDVDNCWRCRVDQALAEIKEMGGAQ